MISDPVHILSGAMLLLEHRLGMLQVSLNLLYTPLLSKNLDTIVLGE